MMQVCGKTLYKSNTFFEICDDIDPSLHDCLNHSIVTQ